MRIFIQPTEALLFRTGHPFNAGENNYAETLFPPTPETLQGAIRATIATRWDPEKMLAEAFQQEELVALIGNQEHYGRFCITGSTLGRRAASASMGAPVERLFPMPTHLWREEDGQRQARLKPAPVAGVATNLPDDMHLLYPERLAQSRLEAMKGWLTESGLQVALHAQGEIAAGDIVESNELYVNEMRVGIAIDGATKTTAEGMLYQVHMIRMNADPGASFVYGFVVDIRLLAAGTCSPKSAAQRQFIDDEETQRLLRLPDHGWLLLGGERKAAYFEVVALIEHSSEQARSGNLLYFATPAALARGWQPTDWAAPLSRPIAIASERLQPIGGWRLTPGSGGGRYKVTRRCVPAGSVYFFRSPVQLPPFLTDYGWQIGYGIIYTGEYQP